MAMLNLAHDRVFGAGRLTIGLMTPLAREPDALADPAIEQALARTADELGFDALWTRDVPLLVPQGADPQATPLDDPFLWLQLLGAATTRVALGMAAAVLPLREPLHLAKSALSLDRFSGGRFILGLGSGDREAEFAAFGRAYDQRAETFRSHWAIVRAALSPAQEERAPLLARTGGFDVLLAPHRRVPMIVVGSARQTLQWTAANADGWATYHRDEPRQQGRISLWQTALAERGGGVAKPFVQSVRLELLASPDAPAEPIELGLRTGRRALVDYLRRMEAAGVAHVLLHVGGTPRPVRAVVEELGEHVLPELGRAAR